MGCLYWFRKVRGPLLGMFARMAILDQMSSGRLRRTSLEADEDGRRGRRRRAQGRERWGLDMMSHGQDFSYRGYIGSVYIYMNMSYRRIFAGVIYALYVDYIGIM